MTTDHVAARTLVKSPPELWAECSDAASLARHIGEFGEITITRLEPEKSVAWEAERASGTVLIEPSAWGTRVTLTAQTAAEAQAATESAAEAQAAAESAIEDGSAHGLVEEPLAEAVPEPETAQEEVDAKVEAAVAQPDPAVAADPAAARGRWKRLIERTRTWFRPPVDELAPLPEGIVEAPHPPADAREEPDPPEPPDAVVEAPGLEASTPAPTVEPPPLDGPEPDDRVDPEAVLSAALDSLGQAHHRPFSRA